MRFRLINIWNMKSGVQVWIHTRAGIVQYHEYFKDLIQTPLKIFMYEGFQNIFVLLLKLWYKSVSWNVAALPQGMIQAKCHSLSIDRKLKKCKYPNCANRRRFHPFLEFYLSLLHLTPSPRSKVSQRKRGLGCKWGIGKK